jgi:hypothetical protein
MSKSKRSNKKTARVTRATKTSTKFYRLGTAYREMFDVGAKKFQTEAEIIKGTMKALGLPITSEDSKTYKRLGFNLAVLKSPGHSSNNNRSKVEINAAGLIKLIALIPIGATAAPAAKTPAKKVVAKKPAVKKTVVTKSTVPAPAPAAAPVAPATTPAPAPVPAVASTETTPAAK